MTEVKNCNKCSKEMKLGVGVANTNIAFLTLTNEEMYDNDDRLIMVCDNKECPNYGLLQVTL